MCVCARCALNKKKIGTRKVQIFGVADQSTNEIVLDIETTEDILFEILPPKLQQLHDKRLCTRIQNNQLPEILK